MRTIGDVTATAPKPTMDTSAGAPWEGFRGALWQKEINVRAFIQLHYTPYEGDDTFLAPVTARTSGSDSVSITPSRTPSPRPWN